MDGASVAEGPRTTVDARAYRLAGIDMLRGLAVVIMAIDHVRDYFLLGAELDPTANQDIGAALFFTRWITHFCAPVFVFLAGTSAGLMAARKTPSELGAFLLKRGIWLIALELTVVAFGWSFSFPYLVFMQVIWAIGCSMIALAALVWLPPVSVLAIGVAIVAGHNLLDPIVR